MKLGRYFRPPAIFPYGYPQLLWRILTDEKKIYLTFDDGPVPGPTDFVLTMLDRYDAKATFFCIGNNILRNHSLYERIIKNDHKIGNHTYDHIDGFFCATSRYYQEVDKCQQLIKKSMLFRPPYGRIRRGQIRALGAYKIVMWDVMSFDFSSINAEKSLKKIIEITRPGSIVVFHDSYKAEKNMKFILPRYLDYFKQKNISFETIPDC